MKAVRLHAAQDLRLEEVEAPSAPPRGHVTLAVRAAGICGSDLHNFRTGQWITRSPSTAGHEFCGRIIAVGRDVTGCRWAIWWQRIPASPAASARPAAADAARSAKRSALSARPAMAALPRR